MLSRTRRITTAAAGRGRHLTARRVQQQRHHQQQRLGEHADEVEFDELPSFEVTHNVVNLVPYGADTYKNDFTTWAWDEVSQGSAVYAMPGDSGPVAFYYNADELAKYHIIPPTARAQFATDAAALHSDDPSAYMTNFSAIDLQWVMSLMAQDNAWPFAYNGGSSVTINWTGPTQMAFASYWRRPAR